MWVLLSLFGHITSAFENRQQSTKHITHYIYPINEVECPSHPNVFCSEDYIQEIRADLASSLKSDKFSGAINLSKIITCFLHDNCHFVVNNFQGADIVVPEDLPILLRRPMMGWLWWRQSKGKFIIPQMIWIYQEFINLHRYTNHSSDSDEISLSGSPFGTHTSVSSIENMLALPPDRYIRLNITRYSIHTKPWNCNAAIYLFPNFSQLWSLGLNVPATFDYDSKIFSQVNILPSKIPAVHLIIVNRNYENNLKRIVATTYVSSPPYPNKGSTISYDILFLLQVEVNQNILIQWNLTNVNLIKLCPTRTNSGFEYSADLIKLESPTELETWKVMSSVKCNYDASNNMLLWNIRARDLDDTLGILDMTKNLLTCENKIPPHRIYDNPVFSRAQRKMYALAQVWKSVTGNYTYQSPFLVSGGCQNGKPVTARLQEKIMDIVIHLNVDVKFNIETSGVFQFPFVTDGDPNDMRIISCGKRGLDNFSITRLFRVYDEFTWLFIFFCTAIVAIILYLCTYQKPTMSISQISLSLTRSLLEQGDPFPLSLMKNKRHQLVIVIFLFATIIITNSFKNTNVYKMITPRKVIPYENLQQLIDDRFTVLTRLGYILYPPHTIGNYSNLQSEITQHVAFWSVQQHVDHSNSLQVAAVHSEVKQLSSMMKWKLLSENFQMRNSLELVTNLTQLHKHAASSLTDIVFKYLRQFWDEQSPDFRSPPVLSQMIEAMKEGELIVLFDEIQKCDKSAVLLPISICNSWQKRLQRLGHPHISVGKEAYFNTKVVFRLEGLLPQYIIKYIISVHESGIWRRWEDLLKGIISEVRNEIAKPEKPNMSGNIIMIFSLLAGNVLAAGFFTIELLLNCKALTFRELVMSQGM